MKLPNFLFNKVKEHKTSLGNNEAFPPEDEFPFDYKILKIRYEEVIENIKKYNDIESFEENYLISLLNKLIAICKEKENPIKEHIEKLCKNIVFDTFNVPSETIILRVELTDKLKPTQKYQLTPNTSKEKTFDFDDLDDFNNAEKSILKRRLINSLIQGASYEYSTKSVYHLDEISSLLSDLKPLYERIIAINDFLLFTKKESITDEKMHQGAIVEVMLGRGGKKTEINVQGLIFPFLLNETFRGLFELFAAHGLPQDLNKMQYILNHSDFLLAEPWDLRMGVTLWNILSENVYGYESMPYFFMSLCEMNTEEFNLNLKEVFAQTKKGKQFIVDLNEYALKEAEYNSNIEPIEISSENDALMTDSYISSNDLDLYYLTDDELNNNVIEEENLLKEGLYDGFDVRDADKIYYNYYEEDFGDEEEPDIQNLYNIQVWDMFSNLIYENDDLNTDELEELLGVEIASKIYNNEGVSNNDEYYPYCLMDFNPHIFGDANETARFIFRDKLTDYFPNLHGFILKDGMCIDLTNPYGNYDHSLVSSSVPQLNDKLDFVAIGNIRCSTNSFDLIHPPTREQKYTLRKLIANSNNLIVDIYSEDTKYVLTSAQYRGNPNPSYVLGQIDRFFDEGINLQGGYSDEDFYMYESLDNTNKQKKIYINESQLSLLTESQESKSISAAKKLLIQRLGYDEQQADEFVRVKLRNDLPVLRTPEGGKFILGVTRMFIDGELRSANDIGNLNYTLKLVASNAHINEYDRNLNGMSATDLISRFAQAMSDNLNAEKEEISQMVFDTPSDYEIVRIDSFEQASQYGEYTSWCVTHDENMFNSYTSDGMNQFYFCLKNGFENIKPMIGENCPLDEYGLSMLAISVNENGMLNTCTCRWNHDNGGNDTIMNTKEISQVISMNFFNVFKPNNVWRDLVNDAMNRLNAGEPINEVFDGYYEYVDSFTVVELRNKFNYLNQEGELLSPNQWYDDCNFFYDGFARVKLNDKFNYININGELLSPNQWFDECYFCKDGFIKVKLKGEFNFINQEGNLLSPNQWFTYCENFKDGFSTVRLNGRYNYLNQEGKILSPNQWFDNCDDFKNGFAKVRLDGKLNFINQEGKILSPNQWFDGCFDFNNGICIVYLNGKQYYINTEGQIIDGVNENTNLQGGYSDEDYDMYESIEYLTESELDDIKPQEKQEINYEDLILSCSEGDIDFREEPYNLFTVSGGKQRYMWTLHVIINGIEIPTELIFLRAEEYPKLQSYQLHMEITKNLRQKGVGFKLYQAFIRIFGTTCDLFINNKSTFYKDNNASIDSDVAFDKLWDKLIKLPNVKVSYIVNKLKQKVGIKIDKI